VKVGRYLRVPESQADVERLWADATALTPDLLPDWLWPEDAGCYRLAATVPSGGMTCDERDALEDLGCVVESSAGGECVYMPEPRCPRHLVHRHLPRLVAARPRSPDVGADARRRDRRAGELRRRPVSFARR